MDSLHKDDANFNPEKSRQLSPDSGIQPLTRSDAEQQRKSNSQHEEIKLEAENSDLNSVVHARNNDLAFQKLTDDEVIEMASAAKNASRFQQLFLGETAGCKSRDEAVLRLLCILAYWTDRDASQMDRLFRQSGLFGAKWDSKIGDGTHGERYIQLAIRKTRETYREQRTKKTGAIEQARQRTQDLLLYAIRTTAVEYAFEAAQFLAQLPASDVGPLKARFKKALGDALNLNDLNKAISEASRKANRSERAREQLKTGFPSVMIGNRPLRDTSDEALGALYDTNNPPATFVRSNSLVRVILDEKNTPIIQDLAHSHVRGLLTRAANFYVREGDDRVRHINPPDEIIQDILTRGSWKFPPLEAIIQCPILRSDGTILTHAGYDPATRLIYFPPPGLQLPSIPKRPSREDVDRSKALIAELLADFPFPDRASKANTYALLLTPLVRHAVRGNVPMALISAPQQGTGKSLLAEVVSMIATGRPAAMMTECRDEEEWGKALTSVLLEGTTVNIIDNVENPLKSAKLAALLTAPVFKHRILGRNVELALANRATWIATGNGLRVGGDMARRCYFIRLDAGMSRPFERENFKHSDLVEWISKIHGQVLILLRYVLRTARGPSFGTAISANASPGEHDILKLTSRPRQGPPRSFFYSVRFPE